MTNREQIVINAFFNCIRHGEYSESYAITLLTDNQRYGWMSNEAKDYFFAELEDLWRAELEKLPKADSESEE